MGSMDVISYEDEADFEMVEVITQKEESVVVAVSMDAISDNIEEQRIVNMVVSDVEDPTDTEEVDDVDEVTSDNEDSTNAERRVGY